MRLRSVILALALGACSIGVSASASSARATTCQGQPATVIGEPRQDVLRGTSGPDVIITNGAQTTQGFGGDDLICSNGRLGTIQEYGTSIDAGAGNDTVDASRSGREADVFVDLGPGDDTYLGGDLITDVVTALNEETGAAEGSDTITTGDGVDYVATGSPDPSNPDTDTVDLGAGADELGILGATDESRPIEGGPGRDLVYLGDPLFAAPTTIDNSTGRLISLVGPLAAWASFERFQLDSEGDYTPPRFVGGDGREYVESRITLNDADLGGGRDTLELVPPEAPDTQGVELEGGLGTDRFFYHQFIAQQSVIYRLGTGAMTFGRNPSSTPYAHVTGFERNDLSVKWLQVTGSAGADQVRWNACTGSVSGWKGDDRLAWSPFRFSNGIGRCRDDGNISVRGQGGDDVLVGGALNDVLLGGAGADSADGGRGTDRCRAETRSSCEKR
ncbi:MAG: calcium-binding protein [Nocardioides sp.]